MQYLPSLVFLRPFYAFRISTLRSTGSLWYIHVYLFVFFLFCVLSDWLGQEKLDAVCLVLAVGSLMGIIAKSESGGWNFSWERGLFGIVPIGFLRGTMGFSLGYLLGRGYASHQDNSTLSERTVTILQVVSLSGCLLIVFKAPVDWIYDPLYLVLSLAFIVSLYAKRGAVWRIFDAVPFSISKYSTAIFFSHQLVITIAYFLMGGHVRTKKEFLAVTAAVVAAAIVLEAALGRFYSAKKMPDRGIK